MHAPRFTFSHTPLDAQALRQTLADVRCGGYCAFEGWVRDHNEGRSVRRLEYEAFESLAVREGERIIAEACEKFGVANARCVHRIGDLALGDLAVWVGVSAGHRDEAFKATRYIIDEVKHRVPIWKKEHYVDGDSGWVNCERCAQHAHDHDHAHDHTYDHAHDHTHDRDQRYRAPEITRNTPAFDYSRQTRLPQVGIAGQARLRASRVVVVGAGGLGVPVLQYLAGAGVGQLTVIDADHLEASNLHRQTWYALHDCGRPKAELAVERIRALNPEVNARAMVRRLEAMNADELLSDHDLLIDCVDNFRSKFLLNDWAQTQGIPLVTASVHQFEGQLQIIDPRRAGSCLRCQWPEATTDGLIGNCAEAGVLGPTPGVLGGLQALEAIKLLLDLPDRLQNELLLVDLLNLTLSRVRAPRRADCSLPCARAQSALQASLHSGTMGATLENQSPPLELRFDDLQDAQAAGYQLIDIREHTEIEQQPLPLADVPQRPIPELLLGHNLPQEGRYLLICARGQRSLATARQLRKRGLEVYSLAGGVGRWSDRSTMAS